MIAGLDVRAPARLSKHHEAPAGTVLHILCGGRGMSIAERLRQTDAVTGSTSDYVALASWEERMGDSVGPYRVPHGRQWTDFPILDHPSWTTMSWRVEMRWRTLSMTMPDVPRMTDALATAPVVVLHIDSRWSRRREADHLLPMLDLIGRYGNSPRIVVVEAGQVEERSLEDLKARYAWRLPHHRFLYNYSFNFRAIANKALLHALRTTPMDPASTLFGSLPSIPGDDASPHNVLAARIAQLERGIMDGVDDPIFLQMLYRLRREGPMPLHVDDGRGLLRQETNPEWVPGLPSSQDKPSPHLFCWRGTGRHPEAKEERSPGVSGFSWYGGIGLVSRDASGAYGLAPAGERFLDLIHPDMEDADVLCRWAGRDPTEKDVAGMDRWIMTKFRKTKTRVNRIREPS